MLIALTIFGLAAANEPSPAHRTAEYRRLSEDMARMAKVGNWPAVERSFLRLEALEAPHTFRVLLNGAYSAREMGDLALAKKRLIVASQLQSDPRVEEWLWSIQDHYSPVFLAADLLSNFRLYAKSMPFVPEHRRAVEYAMERIRVDGAFDGLLPKGEYTFRPLQEEEGPYVFTFDLRRERQSIDLRTHDQPTKRDRRKRARLDKRLEKEATRE